jgi:hypothetical protein
MKEDLPGSPWRVAAHVKRQQLCDALARVPDDGRDSSEYTIALERLDEAGGYIRDGYGMRALTLFYSGDRIERTWACLHEAERALLLLLDGPVLCERLPAIRGDVERFFDDEVERADALKEIDAIIQSGGRVGGDERSGLSAIAASANERSDIYWRDVRAFRNLLVILCAGLAAVLVVLAASQAIDSSLIPLCAPPEAPGEQERCPIGDGPHPVDVAVVLLVGAVGGLLAAILPMRRARRLTGPYGVTVAQTALKGLAGAGSAFIGVLLLQGEVLTGFTPQEGSGVLAYAAFFGFAQHALTRLVDDRVTTLAERGRPADEDQRD